FEPRIRRLPSTNGKTSNDARAPNLVSPTSTAVPVGGRTAIACSIVAGRPIASKAKSGPPRRAAARTAWAVASGRAALAQPVAARRAVREPVPDRCRVGAGPLPAELAVPAVQARVVP